MAENPKIEVTALDYRQFLVETLTKRLRIFHENYNAVLKKPEHEPVHDLRVSIRRLSAILMLLKTIGRNDGVTGVLDDLKSLMAPLGELRDVQVRTEWIEHYAPKPKGAASNLLQTLREKENRLIKDIANALGAIAMDRINGFSVDECIAVLDRRIEKRGAELSALCGAEVFGLLKTFTKRVTEFNNTGKLPEMHRARIALKKFRYTLEIFLPYFPSFDPRELQSLQTRLGNIHDLDLLIEWLKSGKSGDTIPISAAEIGIVSPDFAAEIGVVSPDFPDFINMISADREKRFCGIEKNLKDDLKLVRRWRTQMKKATGTKKKSPLKEARPEVVSLCERFDPDPPHAIQVATLALHLYDGLTKLGLLDLDDLYRTLLEYGCLLHDIGWVDGQIKHHKRAFKMIEDSELPIAPQYKLIIALIARFHRKADPDDEKLKPLLAKKDRAAVLKLAALIRVADVLDRMHSGVVKITGMSLKDDAIVATVPAGSMHGIPPDAIQKKCAYFPKAFGIPITFVEGTGK